MVESFRFDRFNPRLGWERGKRANHNLLAESVKGAAARSTFETVWITLDPAAIMVFAFPISISLASLPNTTSQEIFQGR